jgi:hypothetical protein
VPDHQILEARYLGRRLHDLHDFGPTFAHEKLTEEHDVACSVETLRGWMIAAGIWVPRTLRTRRSYPPRPRRACLGELVQLDGSDHAWPSMGTDLEMPALATKISSFPSTILRTFSASI